MIRHANYMLKLSYSSCSTSTTSCRSSNNPTSITTPSSTSTSSSLYSSSLPPNSHATYHQYCCPARLRLPKPPCALPPAKHHEQAREEEDDDIAHQFCCPASECSSPSSRSDQTSCLSSLSEHEARRCGPSLKVDTQFIRVGQHAPGWSAGLRMSAGGAVELMRLPQLCRALVCPQLVFTTSDQTLRAKDEDSTGRSPGGVQAEAESRCSCWSLTEVLNSHILDEKTLSDSETLTPSCSSSLPPFPKRKKQEGKK
ncbi:unnamed protein product [Pleuronectes platessa]|uniref:Uncharacterized protein n=1 Tax=Pleuronectes platessa TaxID=8262 RepID=A0A9N7URY1_PLEPL|nr:unnamed protein product [Pleuronectes platessa]